MQRLVEYKEGMGVEVICDRGDIRVGYTYRNGDNDKKRNGIYFRQLASPVGIGDVVAENPPYADAPIVAIGFGSVESLDVVIAALQNVKKQMGGGNDDA